MALTYKQSVLVRGTIPALREHGETITTLFYATMLRAHPELNNLFNNANQANGRQPRALTNVILTFAQNLSHTSEIIPRLERTCNKHCSLGILPEHYDIVGRYLLQAFAQVLGPTIWTSEVMAAWQKAYSVLTRMLTGRESQLYKEFAADGWPGFRTFRIDGKVAETDDIHSLYLVPTDGQRLPTFQPGQYVSLRLKVPSMGHFQIRQYSLSDAPRPECYRITVKRDQGELVGKGSESFNLHPGVVSNILVNDSKPGDIVELSHPTGDFHLQNEVSSTQPLVLISAGAGAAPLTSILNSTVEEANVRPLCWLHCSSDKAPFEEHIRRLASGRKSFTTRFFRSKVADFDDGSSTASGEDCLRMDLAKVDPSQLWLDHGAAEYYICGPRAFMEEMAAYLLMKGVNKARIHYEWFTTGDLEFKKLEARVHYAS